MPSPRPTKAPVALILAGLLLTSAISARAQETSLQLTAYASTSQAAPGDTLAVSFIELVSSNSPAPHKKALQ